MLQQMLQVLHAEAMLLLPGMACCHVHATAVSLTETDIMQKVAGRLAASFCPFLHVQSEVKAGRLQ